MAQNARATAHELRRESRELLTRIVERRLLQEERRLGR
jgi:hypothetical protein